VAAGDAINLEMAFPMELPLTGVQIVVEYAIREPSGENWMCFRADARLVA
jgi:hypothetical protein